MCGIIGYTGARQALPVLLEGLEALSYRGYDSAGVALCEPEGLRICRAEGKLTRLREKLRGGAVFSGTAGIGHTRWATHGAPVERNAHPQTDGGGQVAVVHNGIIENYAALREELTAAGVVFTSDTDTEVIPHLLARYLRETGEPVAAIRATLARLRGAYALGILFRELPGQIFAVRRQSPLTVAMGAEGALLASDVPALLPHTREVCYLGEGEIACLTGGGILLTGEDGRRRAPVCTHIAWDAAAARRDGYAHFMEKEMAEVPRAARNTLAAARGEAGVCLDMGGVLPREILRKTEELCFVGCGSAYHVGLAAVPQGEALTGLRVRAEPASEFRYRQAALSPRTLVVAISQSGETADTLAALREAKRRGYPVLGVVNVLGSAIAREADYVFYTQAGPEIAVATTKAYCAQLCAVWCLWACILRARGEAEAAARLEEEIKGGAACCAALLTRREEIRGLAAAAAGAHDLFYIGRGVDAPICREGALKLKEISYLHAEAYEAGELKHGTISLIEEGTPVVALVTQPATAEKMYSNIREVQARGARVLALVTEGLAVPPDCAVFRLPACPPVTAPLPAALAMELLAYEVCVGLGLDPDKPRNLAKSVTVE